MDFRLLGPLEVWDGDRMLALGGSKRRALLALLALNANEVVRTERLADELWDDAAPGNAVASIHNHVSRLRKELGPDVLVTHRWGYVLRVEPETIDLFRFERGRAQAEALPAGERAARLAEALSLWRGPALADLASEPAVARHADRLDELRLAALEERIDADLESGRDSELVAELEALIEENPLREHIRWQLILALYRSGRQAEALEVYRETRRLLSEELGLEPGPELRALELAILQHDPQLVSPSAAPALGSAVSERTRRVRRRAVAALAGMLVLAGVAAGSYALLSKPHVVPPPVESAAQPPPTHDPAPRARPRAIQAARKQTSPPRAVRTQSDVSVARIVRVQAPTVTTRKPVRKTYTPVHRRAPKRAVAPPPATTSAATTTPSATPKPAARPAPTLADPTAWWSGTNDAAVTIAHGNGDVSVAVGDAAKDGFNASVGTRCKIVGDFDAQVSFSLTQWPGADGIWVSLMASDLGGVNTYRTDAFGETYGVYVPPSGGTSVPATGTGGTLRLMRRGGVITGSYLDGSDWVQIFSGDGPTADTAISLGVFNLPEHAPFAGRAAAVDFDAFTLAGALRC